MMRWACVVLGLLVLGGVGYLVIDRATDSGSQPAGGRPAAPPVGLGTYPPSQFLIEHDRFLPANEPKTTAAEDATWLLPDDEVFGVVVAGRARAYPVSMISYHHVVNDVIRGIPVAVTY